MNLSRIAEELELKLGSAFQQAVSVVSSCLDGSYGQYQQGTQEDEGDRAVPTTEHTVPPAAIAEAQVITQSHTSCPQSGQCGQVDFETFVVSECKQVAADLYRGLKGAVLGAVCFFDLSESFPDRSDPPPL